MKGIVSNVLPDDLAPYTASDPNHKIDICVSAIGIYKRMILDVLKVGCMCRIVNDKKQQFVDKYLERVRKELAKQ